MSIMKGFDGNIDDYISAPRRSGEKWVPHFIVSFDQEHCISCGRCIKVCAGGVYIFEDEGDKMVVKIENMENCVGDMSCDKVCPKNKTMQLHKFKPLSKKDFVQG